MANPFDRFDAPASTAPPTPAPGGNPFDRFDTPASSVDSSDGALSIRVRPNNRQSSAVVPGENSISREAFEDRYASDLSAPYRTASGTSADDPSYPGLYDPLRGKADERLIGKPSATNAGLAALYNAGSEAGLNLPGNIAAGIAAGAGWLGREGYNPSFSANRRLFDDQRAAFSRQSPRSGLAGTAAGIFGGAVALPGLAGAPVASLVGRAGQAAVTGGIYGGAAELLDSGDPLNTAIASGVGALGGGIGSAAIEKAAPHVIAAANKAWPAISRVIGRGAPAVTEWGRFTPQAETALREIGLDPAELPEELASLFTEAFKAKGVSPAIAREAAASEFGVPLSRGQAGQDPTTLAGERSAIGGMRGSRAQGIGRSFVARQADALGMARGGIQGMAARGDPLLENPASASEIIADRARQAATDNNFDIAAAQRAEDDARRLARGRDGDALDAASSVTAGVREASGRSRDAYRGAYADVGRVEGEFRPGAFDRLGERVRNALGREMPVDPVVTPAAARALDDLDNLPALLTKPDASGATPVDMETIRRRLLAYRKTTGANAQDRATIDAILQRFDDHVENAEAAGLFGPRQGSSSPREPDGGFPGLAPSGTSEPPPDAIPLPPARQGEPESLTRFLARFGGVPLDAETRGGDLNRVYIPGTGTLARRDAPSWDDIRIRLHENGFLPPEGDGSFSAADVRDLVLDSIHQERIGRGARYRLGEEMDGPGQRATERIADQNAGHAADLDYQMRRLAIELEGVGVRPADLDRRALREAAEARVLGHADDGIIAYDQAVMRRASEAGVSRQVGDTRERPDFDAPFPDLGEVPAGATPDTLPIGSADLTTAMRNARGLFRQHQQNFKPRGPGDDAGRLMQKIIEQDATPGEVANAIFGSTTRPGETGLSVRFVGRLRQALGEDSPALAAVQQGLIARAIDGNGTGDVGRRLDTLLRGNGRGAAQAILTGEQRTALGAFRAALYQTERARQALPEWISDLARKEFDPNAVASGLFGSGVPGERIGSANFARGLKGFLGEDSPEWSALRQAAVMNLTKPGGRTLAPGQEADRIAEFVRGKGAGLAEHLFTAAERAQLMRYGSVVRSTALPSGLAAPDVGGKRQAAAHVLNGLLGALAAKVATPFAASAPFTMQAGQRLLIGGPGAYSASRSFGGGAPRARSPGPVLDLQKIGTGAGLAAEYALP